VQCAAVAISSAWAFVATVGMLWLIDKVTPVRVEDVTEQMGLDEGLHGERAYLEEAI
jgi:Amt family ammonium transporter